ncbi:MAG: CotH kinase family protein [Mariniphaga sp.]|nr:CotH kinase family protein [Mariniphaga sp.]
MKIRDIMHFFYLFRNYKNWILYSIRIIFYPSFKLALCLSKQKIIKTTLFHIGLIALISFVGNNLSTQNSVTGFLEFSSELPIVIINTDGQTIMDEPKITASLQIINNGIGQLNQSTDIPNEYDGFIGIEIRGATSSGYPQTPYGFETRDETGNNLNVPLLGMPEENDWTLLSHYNDKSFLRNLLGFMLFEKLGHYAPRARLCEVIVNNEYQGIYLLTEKIKRDRNRLKIGTLNPEDNEGEELTGGYIFKIDYYGSGDNWVSSFSPPGFPDFKVHFVYNYPKPDEITYQQKIYIQDYVNDFETTLYGSDYKDEKKGFRSYINEASFIDYFLVSEVSRNNDGFKKSRYFFKKKSRKLYAGPVWDFDWAWKNINECDIFKATNGSGWAYRVNEYHPWVKSPGWMIRLLGDQNFSGNIYNRYFDLRETTFHKEFIFAIIDSVYSYVENAQERHFQRWQVLGRNVGAPEVDDQPNTYFGEVEKLKSWIDIRLQWLDKYMVGKAVIEDSVDETLVIYPNPASHSIMVKSEKNIEYIEVFDFMSRSVYSRYIYTEESKRINVTNFASGVYIVRVAFADKSVSNQKFIVARN